MGPLISARLECDSKRLADIRRAAVADAGSSLNQKGGFRSDCVSNSSVELTRQEAADVETTLLACHRAAPTLAVPDDRLAILVRHVEHGIVGNVDPLALKHDLVVVVARLNDCLGRR